MHKVVRRVLNHKYTTIDPDILVEGSSIDFDCYIKRFDDYVIIIKAGTLITAELASKIRQNKKLYVLNLLLDNVKAYCKQYGLTKIRNIQSVEEILPRVLSLNEQLREVTTVEKKIERVYQTTVELMEAIFSEMSEKLPLNALEICVEAITECLETDINVMSAVLHLTPHEYSTHHHSTNVAFFSAILGEATGLTKKDLKDVTYAALLHDIGKIKIDQEILIKTSYLENKEFEAVQRHSVFGLNILQANAIENQKILDGVHYHHEKLDGKGYPDRLRGKRIPKVARIIGMCDAFDALTTNRTYRVNYSSYEALMLMKQEMAQQFDEYYTDTFIRLLGASRK